MSVHNPPRGGTPVGQLGHLGPVEAASVLYLRLCAAPEGAGDLAQMQFVEALGSEAGARAADALVTMIRILDDHGRRPLMRHALGCKCVGADEACFAQMVGAAAEGEMEDAMLMAVLMVRPDMASCLAGAAQGFGLALRRINSRMNRAFPAQNEKPHRVH